MVKDHLITDKELELSPPVIEMLMEILSQTNDTLLYSYLIDKVPTQDPCFEQLCLLKYCSDCPSDHSSLQTSLLSLEKAYA
jgi:hypothetical protein